MAKEKEIERWWSTSKYVTSKRPNPKKPRPKAPPQTLEALKRGQDALKKYREEQRLTKENYNPCDECKTVEWYSKQMNTEIDKEHCPIKCRYNKEVIDNGNND